jgi:DNA end-binding protein Ku
MWTGSIGFGLVNIPVRLFNAVSPRTVRFHEFERDSGRRIRHRRVVEEADQPNEGRPAWTPEPTRPSRSSEEATPPTAGDEPRSSVGPKQDPPPAEPAAVSYQDVVKGYEVEPGRFVMLSPEELRSLRPERSRVIDIQEFVSLDDIDPVYFDRTYYVSPGWGAAAEKPYSLLLRAMQRSRKVGIGSFVLSSRLHLAAIRPRQDVLVLETLFYGDEVRAGADLDRPPVVVEPSDREIDVAVRLIDLLEATWDPSRFRDEYREKVLELIGSKAPEATRAVEEPGPIPSADVADLMAALQASVKAARKPRQAGSRPRRRTG